MKNILFKTSISIIIVLSLMISMFSFVTFAAPGDTILSFSSSSVTVGSSVSVTVKVSGTAISGAQLNVAYDSNILSYVSGGESGGGGIVQIVKDVSPTASASFTINFATIKSGSATISVSGVIADGEFPNVTDVTIKGASAILQVKDAALSSNANLKALSVSAGYLSPKFSANRTSYTVNVKNSVEKCEVYATAADGGATVAVSGSSALKVGTNTRVVTVTAPSGDTKKYTINIVRSETDDEPTAPEETPEVNPLEITEGEFEKFTIISDLSGVTLFKGFSAIASTYNEAEISVASDEKGEYKLYYLKAPEGDETVICTYDEANKIFKQLSYVTQGEYAYILADLPDGLAMPKDYYATNTKIGETDIKCYGNAATPDFFYIYCYANSKYGFYRFDARENVLQRYPELEPEKEIVDEEPAINNGILDRFNSLSTNSKIILIGFIFVVLAVIALIVLLIIKLIRAKKNQDDDYVDESDDFDNISINGNFFITDDNDKNDSNE